MKFSPERSFARKLTEPSHAAPTELGPLFAGLYYRHGGPLDLGHRGPIFFAHDFGRQIAKDEIASLELLILVVCVKHQGHHCQ